MIAASLRWYDAEKQIPARYGLMAFDFGVKTFGLTKAGEEHRASVHLIEEAGASVPSITPNTLGTKTGSSSISPVKIVSISSLLS